MVIDIGKSLRKGGRVATTELIIIRHGATKWNLEHRLQGQSDIELSETGIEQARQLQPALEALAPQAVFTSSLQRAHRTAELAGLEVDGQLDQLQEMGLGQWEGRFISELDKREYVGWRAGELNPPGGETFEDFHARVREGVRHVLSHGATRTAIVAHGGVLRSAIFQITGISPTQYAPLPPGGMTIFEMDPSALGISGRIKHLNWVPLG